MYAVLCGDVGNSVRIDPLQAPDVVTVLLGIGAPLVVSVDPAVGAEVVLGCVGIELVELEVLSTLDDAQSAQGHRGNNCSLATADGAIAASWINDPVREVKLQYHCAAMASGSMLGLDGNATDLFKHAESPLRPNAQVKPNCSA